MRAPWVKNYYNIDGSHYIIPNIDSVVLGGTTQERYATSWLKSLFLVHRCHRIALYGIIRHDGSALKDAKLLDPTRRCSLRPLQNHVCCVKSGDTALYGIIQCTALGQVIVCSTTIASQHSATNLMSISNMLRVTHHVSYIACGILRVCRLRKKSSQQEEY